ncbi:hypothetical protein DWB64_07610 [Fusibacter sp. A1]|nr:hypothetical protein DWB64_07610 [Fusibacter sp. A1]
MKAGVTMEQKVMEKVFESVMRIEKEAEEAILKSKEIADEKDRHLRKQFRDMQLDIMKEVRQNSKLHYEKRISEAKKEEARILKESEEHIARLIEIADRKKQMIAQQVFYQLFTERGKSHG